MSSLVGFTALLGLAENSLAAAITAQRRALSHFKHLDQLSIKLGESRLEVWGHKELSDCVHFLPDGAVLALIGSPHNHVPWREVQEKLAQAGRSEAFELPWDGRVILLKISADGKHWTMWNDWLGSIPIFHAHINQGRIASTLEPVVVAAAKFTADDFFLPGLISLLINGHYLADWTLFKDMRVVPPDCVAEWGDNGFHPKQLWTVKPSRERWETGWDELVIEMYELSRQAIAGVLRTQPSWILPLSAGLDSRLIAAVGAEVGADLRTYSWGAPAATDVIYASQIAKTLGLPWKYVDLGTDYLVKYTRLWADLFGSAMHFHGMYQMPFLESLKSEPGGPILSGYLGDDLSGESLNGMALLHASGDKPYVNPAEYIHWSTEEIRTLFKMPVEDALEEVGSEVQRMINAVPGAWFQRLTFLELWSRQRFFTYFQSTLCDYWCGVATPFLNRAYARFCLSLPRVALDARRLLRTVYRVYYYKVATIPGTYATEPFILTGSYFLKRRIAQALPAPLRRGPLGGFDYMPLTMDVDCVQATGQASLWPIYDAWEHLGEWLDVNQLTAAYNDAMCGNGDLKPIRKLQSVQSLAYRLLDTQNGLYGDPQ
jgi:hypothetical protein